MKKIIINTDGGSRGNPGLAAAAFIISDEEGRVLFKDGVSMGVATNNEAEYLAVKLALQKIREKFNHLRPLLVEIRADSLLIISQLTGKYRMKNPRLKIYLAEIKKLENEVGAVTYTHIRREDNYQADCLVNKILDH